MRTERVLLMEFYIGVSVTVLTSDYDAPDGSPTWEIAMVLLVGILCIELAGWNKTGGQSPGQHGCPPL